MTTIVLDASVIVKWIFADRSDELHSLQALQILQLVKESRVTVVQPPHWLAETAGRSKGSGVVSRRLKGD
ncbi:MAG: hypothetical protein K2Q17_18560 [Nitrospiraceae bacterium]|jgi:predicted nucleic acid-binding protein|uniref:hypothetical protein n=1 Tax=Nitrospira cf. moscoviensis SBR1015 TaxID=96242 RepID=UPI000A098A5A|nr:hypothetical protein [Nitrospira cf. moscoviensis SBR1015]MBY0249660.1 hypothetical protein [Nitrospiraceae bacterium]OQW33855.1 MAG: hypothetical protein A4E20_12420 [Nitrospira sp. SG-bin2]